MVSESMRLMKRIAVFLSEFKFDQCRDVMGVSIDMTTEKGKINVKKRATEQEVGFASWTTMQWQQLFLKSLRENEAETVVRVRCAVTFFDAKTTEDVYSVKINFNGILFTDCVIEWMHYGEAIKKVSLRKGEVENLKSASDAIRLTKEKAPVGQPLPVNRLTPIPGRFY